MNTKKHYRNDKLQKSSKLFLQLGLILALLISYTVLEIFSLQPALKDYTEKDPNVEIYLMPEAPDKFKIKRKKEPKAVIENPTKKKIIDDFTFKEDLPTIDIFEPTDFIDDDDIEKAIGILPNDTTEEIDEYEFIKVEIKPTFKECQELYDLAQSKCFQQQVQRYINKNLRYPEAAANADQQGKSWIEFIIDENGDVKNVKTFRDRKSYRLLDDAAIKAVKKLPKMIPGRQSNKTVKVKYVVPVNFRLN